MPLERPPAAGEPREAPEFLRGPAGAGPSSAATAGSPRALLLRRFAVLVAALAALWLLVMLVGGDAGALAIFRARSRLAELEHSVRALEAENARLREQIRRLERDDRAIERIAREELMMARPDEEVILVPDPRALPAPTATPAER